MSKQLHYGNHKGTTQNLGAYVSQDNKVLTRKPKESAIWHTNLNYNPKLPNELYHKTDHTTKVSWQIIHCFLSNST